MIPFWFSPQGTYALRGYYVFFRSSGDSMLFMEHSPSGYYIGARYGLDEQTLVPGWFVADTKSEFEHLTDLTADQLRH